MAYWRHKITKQVRKSDKKPGDKFVRIKAGNDPAPERPVDPPAPPVTAPTSPAA